jgi:S-DNA-T family DNA segregation ATPase FtsK/SpoIIIE
MTRLHSGYIGEDEIESMIQTLVKEPPMFDQDAMEFLEEHEENAEEVSAASVSFGKAAPEDELFKEAVRIVAEHRTASASMLQRRLRIGYNRAANLIEMMEKNGIVGPQQGAKPRKVLIEASEY